MNKKSFVSVRKQEKNDFQLHELIILHFSISVNKKFVVVKRSCVMWWKGGRSVPALTQVVKV